MRKRYMPRGVFEVGAATIAKLHLSTSTPLEDLANRTWSGYSSSIIDDGVVSDWVQAAAEGIAWLRQNNAEALPEFFRHLQWYCMCHDDAGRPKRKRLFDGLWFQKSTRDPQRVKNFGKKLTLYYAGLVSGLCPPAPDGWSLGNRRGHGSLGPRCPRRRPLNKTFEAHPGTLAGPSWGGRMKPVDLPAWKAGARGRPLRSLIGYKMARQDVETSDRAIEGMLVLLPASARGDLERQAEVVSLLAHTSKFWETDCADFYEWVENASRKVLAERGVVADDDTLFNAFELVCLVLTRHVYTDPEIRRASRLVHSVKWIFVTLFLVGGAAGVLYMFLR